MTGPGRSEIKPNVLGQWLSAIDPGSIRFTKNAVRYWAIYHLPVLTILFSDRLWSGCIR
jgi:hypothetical protein